jgi:AAA+ ATPase superfamily predicted ATPase
MVFPYRSELVLGNKRPALARFDQAFVHHAAAAYEQAGGEILRRFQEDLFPFSRMGKWWQKNQEIDIVAIGDPGEDILFAEVKWSTKKVGIDIYQQLEERSKLVPGDYRCKHYALLSRAGFTAAMEKLAREKNVLLIHGERKV